MHDIYIHMWTFLLKISLSFFHIAYIVLTIYESLTLVALISLKLPTLHSKCIP